MAAQTLQYLYNQRAIVVLLELSARAPRRYTKVYAKELVLNRGVDNLIEFAFVNSEQKPINITGKEITCRLIDYSGKELLLQKALQPILPLTGITGLRISASELQSINHQRCYYSLEIPVDSFDYPVFVDSSGDARGVLRIVDSVLPQFVESGSITIPSHPKPVVGDPKTYYSSAYQSNGSSMLTLQIFATRYTGSIALQGSTTVDFSTYYDIASTINYTDVSGGVLQNITGFHPYIRVKFVNSGTPETLGSTTLVGDVSSIYIR